MSVLSKAPSQVDHGHGSPEAKYQLVEYGDFQCPTCGQTYPLVKQVQKKLGDDLYFVYRHFPLTEMHEHAEAAAETAEYAASKDKFWEMYDLLYKHQKELDLTDLLGYAKQLKLDPDELETALADGTYRKHVHADRASGEHSRVHGTPTFFVNGKLYDGPMDVESLVEALAG